MSYTLPYIDSTTTSINTDAVLFKDSIKNQLEEVLKAKKDVEKQNEVIKKNKDLADILKENKKQLTKVAKSVLKSLYSELQYEYSEEIKNVYFKSQIPSEISKEPKEIIAFCNHILTIRDERNLNEISETKVKIENLKEKTEKISISEIELNSKIETDINSGEQLNKHLQEQFEILKSGVKNESFENKKINFRLYFPAIKTKKTIHAKTIVDEMDFDVFIEYSKLPDELKINKIYLEWYKELKNLFFKKRVSEIQSFKQADELILKKHKK